MDYGRFERLVIAVGAVAIVATAIFSLSYRADTIELVAQLLLLAVLVGAVRWGRRGGTVTAVAATAAYLVMRTPAAVGVWFSADVLPLVGMRIVTYGILGIAGGEACARVKYLLCRDGQERAVDEETRVYTPGFTARVLGRQIASSTRYAVPFSVVTVSVDTPVQSRRRRSGGIARTVADRLRNEVRLADDVGRWHDTTFVVVLPQTGRAGALATASRLRAGLSESLGVDGNAITTRVMSAPDDRAALDALMGQLSASCDDGPAPDAIATEAAQPSSGM